MSKPKKKPLDDAWLQTPCNRSPEELTTLEGADAELSKGVDKG